MENIIFKKNYGSLVYSIFLLCLFVISCILIVSCGENKAGSNDEESFFSSLFGSDEKTDKTDEKSDNEDYNIVSIEKLFGSKTANGYENPIDKAPKYDIYYKVLYNNKNNVIQEIELDKDKIYDVSKFSYDKEGNLKEKTVLNGGKTLSKKIQYYPGGNVEREETYLLGELQKINIFHKTGFLLIEENYENGKKINETKMRNKDVLEYEKKWHNGKKCGSWKYYDENGRIVKEERWRKEYQNLPMQVWNYTYNNDGSFNYEYQENPEFKTVVGAGKDTSDDSFCK